MWNGPDPRGELVAAANLHRARQLRKQGRRYPQPSAGGKAMTEEERTDALATFNEALDEWGCTDPAKRQAEIQAFIADGYDLSRYEERDVQEVVGHA